jgi:uncharacterized protein (DUF2141 family)
MRFILTALSIILLSSIGISQTANLTLKIKNIEEVKGEILLGIYNNETDYKASENQVWKGSIPVTSEIVEYTFEDLPFGSYAISLIHDVNGNGEFDTNWIGFPKEPFGFSNDAKGKMGPPKFEDAKIDLNGNMETVITLIRL